MKYLLIILMFIFIFISCGEEANQAEEKLCQSGYCQEECPERKTLYDIYNKDEILVRICLDRCTVNYTFTKHDDYSSFCHLSLKDSINGCEIDTIQGNWCEGGFLSINED